MTPPTVYVSVGGGDFNCDGTDDHEQINQALKFVAENPDYTTVHLNGSYTYVINGTLLIGNDTTLEGDSNAVIKLADNAGWKQYVPLIQNNSSGNQNIIIRGFAIDGNSENNTNKTNKVISGNNYYDLINLSNCQNVDVHDMYLTNNLGDGLRTHNCSNIKFHDNEAYLLGHDVLSTIKSTDVEAYNNKITCSTNSGLRVYNTNNVCFYSNNITSKGSGGAGIQIQKEGNGFIMDNIEVYNNTIYRTALSGIWIFGSGSYLNSSTNVHVHHNQIYDTGTSTSSGNIGGIVSDGFNATIENNVIDGAYGAGIAQKKVYSSPLNGLGYVIIARNNIITNTRNSSAGYGVGISNFFNDTHSFVLQNNCLYNNPGGDYSSNIYAGSGDIQADPQYADRNNHDYHLKSKTGRWTGVDWVNDSVSSPCIDAGYPLSDYSKEPEPNGGRINIGPDGNTIYASKSELLTPVAYFTADLTVKFIDTSTNSPTRWEWDFGDGTTSIEQNPEHTFSEEGAYTVTLVATNDGGSSDVRSMNITVKSVLTPPVASFTANPTVGTVPLTVKFTDTSTHHPTEWKWSFGDGQTSTVQNPEHTFSGEETYKVTLIATNGDGSSAEKSMDIKVNRVLTPPVAGFTANPTVGTAPLTVKFTDTSTNSPTSWKWNFRDGQTSTVQNPEHTFNGEGTYQVTLIATNGDGSSAEKSMDIKVNRAPTPPDANFTVNKTEGTTPLTVKFTDTSTNSPTEWKWNFDDGTYSADKNPIHTYATAGKFTATLNVSNKDGYDIANKTITVTEVPLGSPIASFTATPQTGRAPLTVKFTNKSSNAATIMWDFGDGTTSTELNPSHTYTRGIYVVKLTVTNGKESNAATKVIIAA
ncbi:PKD domain-containing protein [Methanosarcina sp. UBA5]|uniref:PKD domain-containing protein n=1 Tax=Methanosarcina sp. UBA5 TaxID=1915593 RepID=UPI0025D03251|nr:PKD domain-containing protein [Methanosarcina sp. UBA5]